jgi:F0F1-type ATP synthase epsilon subunit
MAQKQDASTGDYVDDGVKKDHQKELHIKVYSPFKVYFDGYASSLTAVNDTGQFDVLLGHKNFLSLLNPCDIVVRKIDSDQEDFPITRGIIHVENNMVTVFLDV